MWIPRITGMVGVCLFYVLTLGPEHYEDAIIVAAGINVCAWAAAANMHDWS